jgi:hypothetical protein
VLSKMTQKKIYSEIANMTGLKKKNPKIDALIPNVMIQGIKNDKKSMNIVHFEGGNLILQYIQFIIKYEMQ